MELSRQSLQMHRQALGPDNPELLSYLYMAVAGSYILSFEETDDVVGPWHEAWVREGYALMNGAAARDDPRLLAFSSFAAHFVDETIREVEPEPAEPILRWLVTAGRADLSAELVEQSNGFLARSRPANRHRR